MENVYTSEINRMAPKVIGIFTPVLCLLLVGFGVFMLFIEESLLFHILCGGGPIAFGLGFFVYEMLYAIWLAREYELTEKGIVIRYLKRKEVLYPWQSIAQICIWYTGRGQSWEHVIWCSVGNPKRLPPNMRRKDSDYAFRHCGSVIYVEFTAERLEAFRKYYHEEIPDYRSLYGGTSLGYYDTYHPEDGDFPPEK